MTEVGMKYVFVSSYIILCLTLTFSRGDIFSSVAHIEDSIQASRRLLEEVREIAWKSDKKFEFPEEVREVYQHLKKMQVVAAKHPDHLVSHPVRIFRLINNIYNFFNATFHNVFNQSYAEAEECYTIAKVAVQMDLSVLAKEWLKESWKRVPEDERRNYTTIIKELANQTLSMGGYQESIQYVKEWIRADPTDAEANALLMEYRDISSDPNVTVITDFTNETKNPLAEIKYSRICANKNWVNSDWRKLNCYLRDNSHPLLLLQPVRVEEVKRKPYIVLFHDFISEYEIKSIKKLTRRKLSRSKVYDGVPTDRTGKQTISDIRVSKSAFLPATASLAKHVSGRIGAITELETDRAGELLQIANYGVGGYYKQHTDFWIQDDLAKDNRIATVLMYLSDVKAGGATVFPDVDVRVSATKGTAVFWYNLHRSGAPNFRTRHAACPVLLGSKWIASVWIHRYWNEFTRPCGLHEDK